MLSPFAPSHQPRSPRQQLLHHPLLQGAGLVASGFHSHLQATLTGPSCTVPVAAGELVLGTWQQIFHLECDVKPRDMIF